MGVLELAGANLTSPAVIAFGLGAAAGLRSRVSLPRALYVVLSSYLLLAIGFKGGASVAQAGIATILPGVGAAVLLGSSIPLWTYMTARRLGGLGVADAAALAAHYGSVSVVTFTAAMTFLERASIPVEGYMPALVAVMEIPAIVIALAIAGWRMGGNWRHGVVEAVTGRSVLLLLGGLTLGFVGGKPALTALEPVFVTPFYWLLVVFLAEMGIAAAGRAKDLRKRAKFLIGFGIALPVVHGALGAALGVAVGLSEGGAAVLATLAASASYIAAPAAVRAGLPSANPAFYLTAALAVTFPFNLILGVPMYREFAALLSG